MAKFLGIGFLVVVAVVGWQIGGMLSPDAVGLALGIIFGMMAGIPAVLIAMATGKTVRHEHYHHKAEDVKPLKLTVEPTRYKVIDNPLFSESSPVAAIILKRNEVRNVR